MFVEDGKKGLKEEEDEKEGEGRKFFLGKIRSKERLE